MEEIQKKVIELHQLVTKALADPELEPVLRAQYLVLKKDCEALDWALQALVIDAVSDETSAVNDQIQKDWEDPEKQVDSGAPHVFASAEEPEAALD